MKNPSLPALAASARRHAAGLVSALLLSGCDLKGPMPAPAAGAAGIAASSASAPARREPARVHKGLAVVGYNYTDTEIGLYSVNGVGGGNIDVSTETGGGGKTTCCGVIYTPLPPDYTIPVRWTRDGELWCELQVPFKGPVPADAKYLMTHFYRDGHVEIEVGETDGPPRMPQPRAHFNSRHVDRALNVNNDHRFATCKPYPYAK